MVLSCLLLSVILFILVSPARWQIPGAETVPAGLAALNAPRRPLCGLCPTGSSWTSVSSTLSMSWQRVRAGQPGSLQRAKLGWGIRDHHWKESGLMQSTASVVSADPVEIQGGILSELRLPALGIHQGKGSSAWLKLSTAQCQPGPSAHGHWSLPGSLERR